MNSTANRTHSLNCDNSFHEFIRIFGALYYGILIIFGTIGNIISLLVIRGVGQYNYPRPYSIPRDLSEAGSSRNSPDRIGADNVSQSGAPNKASVACAISIPKRQPCRKHPSKSIFTALAIADTIALWVNPFRYWIHFVFKFDVRQSVNTIVCKFHTFLTYASRDLAVWVLCLLTIERYLIGCHPYKAKIIWHGKRKLFAWIITIALIFIKNSVLLGIIKIVSTNNNNNFESTASTIGAEKSTKHLICDTDSKDARGAFFYVDIIFYSIVPTILLLVLNIALYRVIQRRNMFSKRSYFIKRRRRRKIGNGNEVEESMHASMAMSYGSIKVKKSVIQANRLLIPVGVFHLITSQPICIFSIVEDAMQLKRYPSESVRCITNDIGYLLVMLGAATYGFNCVIYFLSSKIFRERLYALTAMMPCCRRRKDLDAFYRVNTERANPHKISATPLAGDINPRISE